MVSIRCVGPPTASPLSRAIRAAEWGRAGFSLTEGRAEVHLLVAEDAVSPADQADVRRQAAEDGALLILAGPALVHLRGGPLHLAAFDDGHWTPLHEARLRVTSPDWPRGDVLVTDRLFLGLPTPSGGHVVTANVAYAEHDMLSLAHEGDVAYLGFGSAASSWSDWRLLQLVRTIVADLRRPRPAPVGVALLGFGAIGAEHAAGVSQTPGLELVGVCDSNPARLATLRDASPAVTTSADELLGDTASDLVVVSTPPDSHALWALRALDAGKHVVVEKPMALTVEECDAILQAAADRDLTAVVYQNRRFDPDYRVLTQLRDSGALGEILHLEAFVGGFGHPCNYWHSDAAVSGGALFDWGSHIVDQILDLMPQEVDFVTARNHKRVWHDVTNADHSRMTLTFADGAEAMFVYSDVAAALKPRWYVAGTSGGVIGEWRSEKVVSRSAVGTLAEDLLAPADSPPVMTFTSGPGSRTTMAYPPAEMFPFHADLALRLRYGIPMRVSGAQSRRVVAMLQAAEESALLGGIPVKPR